jgi:hypothetical protein
MHQASDHPSSTEAMVSTEYTPPEVVDYGDLAELTAGAQNGWLWDAAFPAGRRRWPGFSVTFP